jgi:hypothetical protein
VSDGGREPIDAGIAEPVGDQRSAGDPADRISSVGTDVKAI